MRAAQAVFAAHNPLTPNPSPATNLRLLPAGEGKTCCLAAIVILLLAATVPADGPVRKVRELFVPFDALDVLLEAEPHRVLMSREEYEELWRKARQKVQALGPLPAAIVAADYAVTVAEDRAQMTGKLAIDVLDEGIHPLALDLSGVGLRRALWNGDSAPAQRAAAIGRGPDGRLTLFVQGRGRHELILDMVAPLETTAAQQVIAMRLPRPPAARMTLTVPGDVEIKSGADVASRIVDQAAKVTRFELVPKAGDTSLVMTLNSHLQRRERAVLARSVLVDEVTEAYERLHATVSLGILHRAVDNFRFVVPEGFEVTEVATPLLSRWAMTNEGKRRILEVRLREQTTDTTVLNLSALKTSPRADRWTLPKLEPLDVDGQVAVVGLLIDQRLQAESIAAEGLIPIDTDVLTRALPATVLRAEPGSPTLRPVVAYYAPQADFGLTARFAKPAAQVRAITNLLLVLEDRGPKVQGSFVLTPEFEKLFGFEFSVPDGWQVTAVTAPDKKPLSYERYGSSGQRARVRVRLAQGVAPRQSYRVEFTATASSGGLLVDRQSRQFDFPAFAVAGAARDAGAIAIDAREDMVVRPKTLELLTPLGENEKAQYGLAGVRTSLAYRYDSQPYRAELSVERSRARVTAQTFSFLRVEPDALAAHYEIVYQIEEARTQQLSLSLPESTPAALKIRGLDNVELKEFLPSPAAGGMRRWNVLLVEPRRDRVRLAIDFQQPYSARESQSMESHTDQATGATGGLPASAEDARADKLPVAPSGQTENARPHPSLAIPIVRAEGVAYQSGMVAVEGSAELDVQVATAARRIDVGELVDAEYQPGRRLLGAYGFAGDPVKVEVTVTRHPGYWIDPAIVQKAELTTFLSADGVSQTAAWFQLRTKALYLDVRLPDHSELWSAEIDGKPIKPQKQGDTLLMSLPAAAPGRMIALQIVYETPVNPVSLAKRLELRAPSLVLHNGKGSPSEEVPMADLAWRLYAPTGYQVYHSAGTVVAQLSPPEPAALTLVKAVAGSLLYSPGPVFLLEGCGCAPAGRMSELSGTPGAKSDAPASAPYYMSDDAQYGPPSKSQRLKQSGIAVRSDKAVGMSAPDAFSADLDMAGREKPPAAKPATPVPQVQLGMPERELREEAKKDMAMPAEAKPVDAPKADADTKGGEKPRGTFDWHSGTRIADIQQEADVAEAGRRLRRSILGFSSLKIDLQQAAEQSEPTVFQSLGVEPRLVVTLANGDRLITLRWFLALTVLLVGAAWTNRRLATKVRFIVAIILVGTVLPLIPGLEAWAGPCNAAVYAALLLAPYYLLVRPFRRLIGAIASMPVYRRPAATTTSAVLALLCTIPWVMGADGAPSPSASLPRAGEGSSGSRYVVQVVEPPEPVKIPEDAVIVPYDPDSKTGVQQAGKMLVPYAKYVELWNLAHPDKKLGVQKAPADYALAGGSYSATLEGDDSLTIQGQLEIDVFVDRFVTVPFGLAGCVLSRAELDGQPARLSVAMPEAPAPATQNASDKARPATGRGLIVLHVAGKGRHKFELAVRLRLDRRGGWRVAEGTLPSAPAALLTLTAPQPKTEVRLGQVRDRRAYETEQANQKIETALGPEGHLSLQWRPKVAEGQVDRSLTAQSRAVLDVQEDGLRVVWQMNLAFPRSQRETFRVRVPSQYLVEKVEGTNVRGWETRKEEGHQSLEISLLKPAKDREQFTVRLWRSGATGRGQLAEFDVPMVLAPDASLHNGDVTIRRSPLLELRTVSISGVTRTDLTGADERGRSGAPPAMDESPLGIRPHQAYHFVATPFTIRLAAGPVAARVSAEVSSILKISDYERSLETRVKLDVRDRPIHEAQILLPGDLRVDEVTAPGEFLWALTRQDDRPLLTVYLTAGRQGEVPILIRGLLGRRGPVEQVALPSVEVRDVVRQQGDLAVQLDPVFQVQTKELKHCELVLLQRLFSWLNPQQRQATRLAIHYTRPDYQGTLRLSLLRPVVTCSTITNVRITDRAVEETVLLNFKIEQAGIRGLTFLLPAWMADSRISVPMLREKSIQRAGDAKDSPVRVKLDLQDEVMGELRVLVQNDRLLNAGGAGRDEKQPGEPAPIPVVEAVRAERQTENVRTDRQFVVLENVSRDELVVASHQELEPLGRSQKDWATLHAMLGGNITQAYVASVGAKRPQLFFHTQQRTVAETAKARVRFAETRLMLDAHGAYRAQQLYKVDNKTEQFLAIEMPDRARLWTAWVAGEPVKPIQTPGAADARQVSIPLVKTAAGDLDYDVLLQYGGQTAKPGLVGAVNFPLIRVLKLDVELSQVRLFLPDTHRWFDFGGTLRRVKETDLQAGLSSYQKLQVQSLVETARQGSFGGIRAMNSLESLVASASSAQHAAASRGDQSAQRQTGLSLQDLQAAQQELKQLEQVPAQAQTYDNRGRLNEYFEGQRTLRSRNVTNDLGDNFDSEQARLAKQPAASGGGQLGGLGGFNPHWLDKSQVANAMPEPSAEQRRRLATASESQTDRQFRKKQASPAQPQAAGRPTAPSFVSPREGAQQPTPSRPPADRSQEMLNRYQQKHQQQQHLDMLQQSNAPLSPPTARDMPGMVGPAGAPQAEPGPLYARIQSGEEGEATIGRRRVAGLSADGAKTGRFELTEGPLEPTELNTETLALMAKEREDVGRKAGGQGPAAGRTPGGAVVATGLASLSVELPWRGTEYLFTTPRGDVALRARAVSRCVLDDLVRVAAVVAAILTLLWIGRLAWQGRFAWWATRLGSTMLVSLGILSLAFGVAMLAGLLMLGAGIAIKVRRSLEAQSGSAAEPVVAAHSTPGESPAAK